MGKRKQTIKVVFKQITSVHNWIAVLWQTPEASVERILELHSHSHCLQVLLGSVHSQPLSAYSTESKPYLSPGAPIPFATKSLPTKQHLL